MVLIEPPPLLESVAGRKYHYPHTFHCPSEKLFRILKLHIYRSSNRSRGVWLLRLPRFYTSRVINVPAKLLFNFQVDKRNDSFHRPLLLLATKSQNYNYLFFVFKHVQHLAKILIVILFIFLCILLKQYWDYFFTKLVLLHIIIVIFLGKVIFVFVFFIF